MYVSASRKHPLPGVFFFLVRTDDYVYLFLCVLHRKTDVHQSIYTIFSSTENLLEISMSFVYNTHIAVHCTPTGYSGRLTPFPKGVFDHYVHC